MTRYKITVEYDGTDLIGWQENRQGPSVQSILRDAVEKFCGARPDIVAAGRTDAGVHAIAMVAHFDLDEQKNPETVMRAMNFYLSDSPVSVLSCDIVPDDFHARFSCVRRNYRYVVLNRGARPVLEKNRVWWVPRKLNMSAMRCAAEKLVGHHDFTSFRASECQAKSPIKTLDSCTIKRSGEYIIFEFSARSFLHHQVRNMVGTLVEIGLGKPYDIDEIFAAKNRSAAGPTAPASGLFFVSADYATDDCGEHK
ncbi:MAG TPA: tRNA pseudouridine(38-40) synthase TruA [Candidatus Enterousia avicola]|uniref:tRNA pseudouridine synthase A n=1 Tax=Candidatus Enterousia avicola TaxID=2840787 RepID=A0A9D1MSG6_9PROT|nr:tRNA pseudouridine(38-40) synthase TruA [Candidatus Enterousia avicola]